MGRSWNVTEPAEIRTLEQLVGLLEQDLRDLYVRFAPDGEVATPSVDHESGLTLPGAAVNPLRPPEWWVDRPIEQWLARQIGTYSHLQDADPHRVCWIVQGDIADRGPDNEPLLAGVQPVAVVAAELVDACRRATGEDNEASDDPPPWQQPT
jgi:Family of unknown function (DUF6098)